MYCFPNCCRSCLTKDNTLVNIKLCGSDGVSFLDKLGLLAPSLITNPRDYIIWICEQCRKKLEDAYSFIQHCLKSNAVFNEYCKQLPNVDPAQNKCTDPNVSVNQFTDNMINESVPMSFKQESFEDLPVIDDNQYCFESTTTIQKHEVPPADFEYIKVESLELKQEPGLTVGDDPTSNDAIIVSEYDRLGVENVQIDPIAGTSSENYISPCSEVSNNAKEHTDTPPNKRSFKCGICNKEFAHSCSLKQHETVHSGERPYECQICYKRYANSKILYQHEKIHSGERPYECKICKKRFIQSGNLKQHEKVHTGERPFECKTCNKKFINSAKLLLHERVHTGERPYECKICNRRFTQAGNLKEHEKGHSRECGFFNCVICNKKFYNSEKLVQHHEKFHSNGDQPFECKICKKIFTHYSSLYRHEVVHSGTRTFECKICNKMFNQPSDLKRHEPVHSGERPFECKICNKSYTQSSALKRHETVHSNAPS